MCQNLHEVTCIFEYQTIRSAFQEPMYDRQLAIFILTLGITTKLAVILS